MKTKIMTNVSAKILGDQMHHQFESLPSLDMDYDMWAGQFQIMVPFAEVQNDEEDCVDDDDAAMNAINSNYHHNSGRSKVAMPQLTQILDNEDVFLSLHPSDFESLNIVGTGVGGNNTDDKRQQQWNTFFPKTIQNIKGKDLQQYNNGNNNNGTANGSNSNNNNSCNGKNGAMSGETEALQQRLSEKLEILQRQVTNLADTQNNVDDIKSRTKADYAVLQARYHMLEEQLRDAELRAEEKLAEEQKRHRELLNRAEREAQLQNENCEIRMRTFEHENNNLRDEIQRMRMHGDKQAIDSRNLEEKLEHTRDSLLMAQQELVEKKAENKRLREERATNELVLKEMESELEHLRKEKAERKPDISQDDIRIEELLREIVEIKDRNKSLEETNDELQALVLTRGVEQGIHLLNGTSASLAKELEAMGQTQDTIDSATLESLTQLQAAYKDIEEENKRLKHYIDTILLNIVENYPQLLEVKSK